MYKLVKNERYDSLCVLKIDSNTYIPFVAANTDYQDYLKWLEGYEKINGEWVKTSEGNTPQEAD